MTNCIMKSRLLSILISVIVLSKAMYPSVVVAVAPIATSQRQNPPQTARVPKPSANAAPGVSFVDVTKTAGLGGFRFVSGSPAKNYIIEAPGAGCAFIDYDNDGWLGIYLVNGSTLDALRGKAKAPRAALHGKHP